jgi:DNA-directed RNA polymerase subunit RPC12/RpoP
MLNLAFTCQSCGEESDVSWSQVGQNVRCGGCGATSTVPAPRETIDSDSPPPPSLRFACPACGRKYSTKPEMAGRKIRCNRCGAGVRVPGADGGKNPPASRTDLKTSTGTAELDRGRSSVADQATPRPSRSGPEPGPEGLSSLLEDLAGTERPKGPRRAESVLSPRSAMIEKAQQQVEQEESVRSESQVAKTKTKKRPKKKKKKHSSYFDPKETLKLVAGVGAFVALLAFLAWGYPGIRFPVGGLLCVTGFIVYLMGAFSLRRLVAEEGFVQALMFRFCPPYQWWFIWTRWDEAKDFFAFFAAGMVAMAIGGGIIKTSPEGKKADASDRAFQKAQQSKKTDVPPVVIKPRA